jgi:hypothetical protein
MRTTRPRSTTNDLGQPFDARRVGQKSRAMKPVNLLIWVVAALLIAFVIINWGMLAAPIQASFGFTRLSVPLWLVLLGLAAVLTAVFFGVRVPFVPRVAVVTIQPCRISQMRNRDVPPILRFPGNFQDPIDNLHINMLRCRRESATFDMKSTPTPV